MIAIRKALERGHFDFGWLDTRHTFSFGEYQDPRHMGFRSLRVINEDVIQPGKGFGTHGHRDMEIITYVITGEVQHRDSEGHSQVLSAGRFQGMTAGSGIEHSEWNPSSEDPLHLYQIWIRPDERGLVPSYRDLDLADPLEPGESRLIASQGGGESVLKIHQDASIHHILVGPERGFSYTLPPGRHAWIQAVRGNGTVNGQRLDAGDGAALSEEEAAVLASDQPFEVLLFDLT